MTPMFSMIHIALIILILVILYYFGVFDKFKNLMEIPALSSVNHFFTLPEAASFNFINLK